MASPIVPLKQETKKSGCGCNKAPVQQVPAKKSPPVLLFKAPVAKVTTQTVEIKDTVSTGWDGSVTWAYLAEIASSYSAALTPQEQFDALLWIMTVYRNIPCVKCRDHALAYIKSHPINVTSKDALLKYLLDQYNFIAAQSNKKQLTDPSQLSKLVTKTL